MPTEALKTEKYKSVFDASVTLRRMLVCHWQSAHICGNYFSITTIAQAMVLICDSETKIFPSFRSAMVFAVSP